MFNKIKTDFVDRKETAMISLEEGNLIRTEKYEATSESIEDKKPKICSTCIYAKVRLNTK